MNDKKNIDRLFREKFKDFEVAPPELVWENIEEALREKKKRRVIPLWMRLSGVAAILVAGTFFMSPYYSGIDSNDNPVVIEKSGTKRIHPTDNPVQNKGTIIGDSTKVDRGVNSAVADGNDKAGSNGTTGTGTNKGTGSDAAKGTPRGTHTAGSKNAVAHDGSAPATGKQSNKKARHNKATHSTQAVAQSAGTKSQGGNATNGQPSNSNDAQSNGGKTNRVQGSPTMPGNNSTAVAGSDKKVQQPDGTNPSGVASENSIINKEIPVEQAIAEIPVDTTAAQTENPLEKLLQEKLKGKPDEDKAVAENSDTGKWNIKPQVAPVFYNSLSGGSPIDGQFADNSKSFDNDLSYGVGVNYAVNNRLSVRSGINTVNLSYATNDVQFRASLSGQTNNIAARTRTANIVVQSQDQTQQGPNGPIELIAISGFSNDQVFKGSMIQKTGYIEVPVEMSYALVNRKFGIDVIGGVSTLFLNENNVSVVSTQGYSTEVGEAQNLNSIHFSTNVGLGFKYRFWKSFQANFEPTFKYQVNAYSRDAGNFKPYFIGLYSGISFSF